MKRTIKKACIVVLAIVTVFFLYVFARSLPLNLSLQGLDSDNLEAISIWVSFFPDEFGIEEPSYTALVTDKAIMKNCIELLQKHTYKYQTAGTPFGVGDMLMQVRFRTGNRAENFEIQMYRENDKTRDFGIKTKYKGHEYYINRFSEEDEKQLYNMFYEVAKADPSWHEIYTEKANPVQMEDTMLP